MPLYQIDENKNFVPVQDTKKTWELTYTYVADNKSLGFTGNTDEITTYIQENFNNITCLSLCIQGSTALSNILLFTKGLKFGTLHNFFHRETNDTGGIVQFNVSANEFTLLNVNSNYIVFSNTGTAILTIY